MSGLGDLFSDSTPNQGGLTQVRDTADLGTGTTRPSLRDISVGIAAGGLRGRFGVDDLSVTSSANRRDIVGRLARSFVSRANDLSGIRDLVRPGFSEFRRAGLAQLESRRDRAVGNLRENLARRRIAGSSFANDALARAEAEFAQEAASFSASSTLQEIDVFTQLTNAVGELRAQKFQTQLAELNLQADVALALQKTGSAALSAASLAQQAAAVNSVNQATSFGKFGTGFGAAGGGAGGGGAGGGGAGFTQPTVVEGGRFAGQSGR